MNLSQATYDRIKQALGPKGDTYSARVSTLALRDLLEAYEEAIELLDECQNIGIDHPTHRRNVEDFLYLENGEPRVHIQGA